MTTVKFEIIRDVISDMILYHFYQTQILHWIIEEEFFVLSLDSTLFDIDYGGLFFRQSFPPQGD